MDNRNSFTRRAFIKAAGAAGAASLVPWGRFVPRAFAAFQQTMPLRKFVDPMRRFGIDIPVGRVDTAVYPGVDYYEISMRQFTDKLHRDLDPTTLWGYGNKTDSVSDYRHLGGAILARQGTPVRVRWTNELPNTHPLPVDPSVVAPYVSGEGIMVNRAAVHLHGGLVPWPSDGGPFHWFSSTLGGEPRVVGPSVINWLNGTDDYWYPNNQSARYMWYHDHAVGITRLNAYAGLATGYILTDSVEEELMDRLGILPETQIPIVIQDKVFHPDGRLYYPDFYDTDFFALEPPPGADPLPVPSLVPEFWGDTILVNGTVYPFLEVEPRRYRIRILNACNTRFLSLRLLGASDTDFPGNTEPSRFTGPSMLLIGTEGGFLDGAAAPKGVVYDNRFSSLVIAPAERADLIVDFSGIRNVSANNPQYFILYNEAPVPFPGGTRLADFHPLNRDLATPPSPGFGPATRTLLQFKVVPRGTHISTRPPSVDPTWTLPPYPVLPPPVQTRQLGLYETIDEFGRLAQNLGTLAGPQQLIDAPTEVAKPGTIEKWEIFNFSADTHPIHFHFVNVRVLQRQVFWVPRRGGSPVFLRDPIPPEPDEQGWKETVRMHPRECITLLVEIPTTADLAPEGVEIPDSPRLLTDYGIRGAEYVWHCHILEHEEHDMMRPFVLEP